MTDPTAPARASFGIHIHIYLSLAVLIMSVALFIVAGGFVYDGSNFAETFWISLGIVVLFLAGLWYARRRCLTPDLGYWEGLRLITAYMTVGIGGFSILFAVPVAIVAIVVSLAIALIGAVRSDASYAARNFRRLVTFFGRHRMYQ